MNKYFWLGLGLICGGIAGLLLAPDSGRHTRALVRDKSVKYSHDVADLANKKSRHVANKVKGYTHEVKSTIAGRIGRREADVMEEAPSI